ncbi:G protein-coupled receptor, rhodopsin-like family and GPCR, rhodopsin-like, 7TM domain-containing protein [Strongyloides ratti]|uniref:G protein-coupled receptor, rhodopsin-like family and GPCR, rhodopsin-like, 7TM domain-containing protein n=1 Tax=Strongyloides ratti TaxID=34506 RepID=A0A090KS84_STRRB|nr:G protein-coupled receptor, rhodopsin-like family and GPCR, rhodopsin-like, 7TM domain-containing protein [Strongyloides ratti]CEF60246.1 G protein-coupled receptor, rhodopsin-like family and GPCR, rhodopsin-like, 7TM domain-containing protein [Strongyloides ratti]
MNDSILLINKNININQLNLRTWKEKRDDWIVVSIWLAMLSYALISNIIIIFGILRSNTMRAATSYWFIISLAICDIVMIIISLAHLIPATAFHESFTQVDSLRNIVMLSLYDLFWYTAVLQLGLMAFNRFISIVYPMEYKCIFSRKKTKWFIAIMYILGGIVSLPTLHPCCNIVWDSELYITRYLADFSWHTYVDMTVNSFSLLLMVISYAIIIYKVRESSKAMAKYQLTIRTRLLFQKQSTDIESTKYNSRTMSMLPPRGQVSKKEMRLFIQFFVVSLVFLITWTTWQWLPNISDSKWAYFVMTSLFFINNSVNPTVYIIFNTQLRRELCYMFCKNKTIKNGQSGKLRNKNPAVKMLNYLGNQHKNDPSSTDGDMVNSNSVVCGRKLSLTDNNKPEDV